MENESFELIESAKALHVEYLLDYGRIDMEYSEEIGRKIDE